MTSLVVMVSLLFFAGLSFAASAALTDDTYADSTKPSKNFWNKQIIVNNSKGQTGYVRFDLGSLPAGATGADVEKATLTFFVSKVTNAGSLDIRRINAPSTVQWEEGSLTYENSASTAPIGNIIATVNVETWMEADIHHR